MNNIYAVGIIPSTTEYSHLTYCENIQSGNDKVTDDMRECSINNLDNAAMIDYFNMNCAGQKHCEMNMA